MNDRQRTLVPIGALAGKGDIDRLKTALHDGMDGGMTVSDEAYWDTRREPKGLAKGL